MGAMLSPYSLAIQYERGLYLIYSYSITCLAVEEIFVGPG